VSPRRSLTTNVLPSRMLIRRGCNAYSLPARTIFTFHGRPDPEFRRAIRWFWRGRQAVDGSRRGIEGRTVTDTAQEPPHRVHQRLRIAMVAPPWYELPPLGYGGLEVITAALVDGLVDRGHDVTLFGAGHRTGTPGRVGSTTGALQYPRPGELMTAPLHNARGNSMIP